MYCEIPPIQNRLQKSNITKYITMTDTLVNQRVAQNVKIDGNCKDFYSSNESTSPKIKLEYCDLSTRNVAVNENIELSKSRQWEDWAEFCVKEEPDGEENFTFELSTIKKENENEDWSEFNVKEDIEIYENEESSLINESENLKTLQDKNSNNVSTIEESINNAEKTSRRGSKKRKYFHCDQCPYKTNWKGNLTKHVVSRHTALEEIKWFECEHCSYKGKTRDYLKWHLLHIHSVSVKWYNCPKCPFKAKLQNILDRHMIVNHTETEKIKWFTCDQCSYRGKLKINLKQHILSKHTESSDITWFQCDYCEFKAKRKRNLKFHQINKHTDYDKIHWFQCEQCPYKVKRKSVLKVHIFVNHTEEGQKSKKAKPKTREIPVFIDNKLCWKRVVVDDSSTDYAFKCTQCKFETLDKENFKKHILRVHTVTEIEQEDNGIVKKTYKTKDVVVMVNNVPYVKKVIDIDH